MQHTRKEFDEEKHEMRRALSVKQPYADHIMTPDASHPSGCFKNIEVRTMPTSYRGDLVIASSRYPQLEGHKDGVALGIVELYDVKPVSEFTDEDWERTRIDPNFRECFKHGYGWLLRNPRPVENIPIHGMLGIYYLVTDKGDIK